MASQAPLALGYGWRKNEDLIDALPYVDPLTPEDKRAVEKLIEEEMRHSSKRPADYLKELPPILPSVIKEGSIIFNELERIRRGEPMAKLDVTRYQLNPPPQSKRNDAGEWRKALDNAYSQLEHQELRLMNLELQVKYGPNVWRAYNQQLDNTVKQYEQAITELRQEIEETNRARKLYQMSVAEEMRDVESKWLASVRKNVEIEWSCRQLEAKIAEREAAKENHEAEGEGEARKEAAEEVEGGAMDTA